jgi:hypothetical protein
LKYRKLLRTTPRSKPHACWIAHSCCRHSAYNRTGMKVGTGSSDARGPIQVSTRDSIEFITVDTDWKNGSSSAAGMGLSTIAFPVRAFWGVVSKSCTKSAESFASTPAEGAVPSQHACRNEAKTSKMSCNVAVVRVIVSIAPFTASCRTSAIVLSVFCNCKLSSSTVFITTNRDSATLAWLACR